MRKRRTSEKTTAFREGQLYCPVHNFALYRAIRASPELPPGVKVVWEALVEKTFRGHVYVDCSYDALADAVGLSRDQARRDVGILIHVLMLRRTPRFKDGHQKSNHFEFLWRDPKIIEQGRMGLGLRRRGGTRALAAASFH
jgi:hypothetical protein